VNPHIQIYRKVTICKCVLVLSSADFPVPNITELKEPSPFNVKRIKCSTAGGFPKPHISWWENGEELNTVNTTISQNPETELYTVSSELEFNVTSNHSLLCLVKYGNSNVSQTFTWKKRKQLCPGGCLLYRLWEENNSARHILEVNSLTLIAIRH
jgi:programmed cell death 1 ligand 1